MQPNARQNVANGSFDSHLIHFPTPWFGLMPSEICLYCTGNFAFRKFIWAFGIPFFCHWETAPRVIPQISATADTPPSSLINSICCSADIRLSKVLFFAFSTAASRIYAKTGLFSLAAAACIALKSLYLILKCTDCDTRFPESLPRQGFSFVVSIVKSSWFIYRRGYITRVIQKMEYDNSTN